MNNETTYVQAGSKSLKSDVIPLTNTHKRVGYAVDTKLNKIYAVVETDTWVNMNKPQA